MRFKSIKTKLTVAVALFTFAIITAMAAYSALEARKDAITTAKETAKGVAGDYAAQIETQINVPLDVVGTLEQMLCAVKDPQSPLKLQRDQVNTILSTVLAENQAFHCIYTVWEPNAFDGRDADYANAPGADKTGRFAPDWDCDENGNLELGTVNLDESGGLAKYYRICKRTMTELITDLRDDHEDGLIVSLLVPIVRDGQFYGIVGVDLLLETFQKTVDNANLYQGKVQVNIISNSGKLAAVSKNPGLAGKHMKVIHEDWREDIAYVRDAVEIIEEDEGHFAAFSPIHIGQTNTPWSVNINVPYELITAEATYHAKVTIIIGFCLAGISLLAIYLMVGRFIQPLLGLTKIAQNLAKGDLEFEEIKTADDEIGKVKDTFSELVTSFREITTVCQAVSLGDFSRSVTVRSDKDVLGKSVNQMAQTLRSVVAQANKIAQGDYSTQIVPQSDADELGAALSDMTTRLRETTAENERQAWLKTGQATLNDCMRGEQTTITLAQNIIIKLAEYLEAPIGAIYLAEEDETLRMVGSYAHTKRKSIANEFKFGQGLVGQAAIEKKSILVTDLPEDYVPVRSGLGHAVADNVFVLPFYYEGKVKGVIELGSFGEFTPTQIKFLEKTAEGIAITVNSAQSRAKLTELLEKTQRQSEELQKQQEELRSTNEELETQTQNLKASEETLKAQQEELEIANAELEEKTAILGEQKRKLEGSWNQLKTKSQQLQAANKYKSEFLSNMSHELRTPLNSLLILSKMLADNENGNLTQEQADSAELIHESGTELLSLINEILDLSKIEAGKMQIVVADIKISDLAADIRAKFKHVAKAKKLEFSVKTAKNAPRSVKSDSKRVKQIIKNFLSNAIKFTDQGGVTVNIGRPAKNVTLTAEGLDRSNAIAIAVSDTGVGIPLDKQKLVMEAFQQVDGSTSRTHGGTGLGLSISQELTRLLGGEIQLQSTPGKGSTFTLYLPQKLEKTDSEQADPPQEKSTAKNNAASNAPSTDNSNPSLIAVGKKIVPDDRNNINENDKVILIIEDDPKFAAILVKMAHQRDFKCLAAGDGETGLKFAVDHRPLAIMLDIGLPGMDGMKVMDVLKNDPKTRCIPVHFISAAHQDDSSRQALEKGAIGYLTKPVTKKQLNEAFTKVQDFITQDIKKLLVVEDDKAVRSSVVDLIASDDVEIEAVGTAKEAYDLMTTEKFDCMVVDLGLPDMSGFELLSRIRNNEAVLSRPPVIVYSGRELSRKEHAELKEYTASIIIKGKGSTERLLDETSLFLHRVETDLPTEQQRMIKMVHDKDAVLSGKKVLVVDDDMRNIFAVSHALKAKGMTVLRAENGQQAVETLEANPDTDIVLMDIMMPVMDGYEAMRKIRDNEKFWKLPILALTAKAMKGDKEKCIEAGANDYLAKPLDIEKVMSMLRVWLYL